MRIYDAGKTITGLAIFIVLITAPFWVSGGKSASSPKVYLGHSFQAYLPLLYRSERMRDLQVSWVEQTQGLWRGFDRTWVAEWLGFYYFSWGIKPS